MKDIIEIPEQQAALVPLRKEYSSLVMRSIADIAIIFDVNFHIAFANKKTYHVLKRKNTQLVGQHISILFPKNQGSFVVRLQENVLLQEQLYNYETAFRVLGQKHLPVSVSLSAIREQEETTGYLLIARDLKHLTSANDFLKSKNKELETFVYRVSHDLKGPLASVSGLLELVEQEEEDIATYKHYIKLIKSSTQKLEKTLSGLLEIGVSTSRKVHLSTFNVRECIEDVMRSFEGYPGSKNVILQLSAKKDLMINTEEKTFRSVMQNLIENSIKYRKVDIDDAVTKISARKYKSGYKIKVKDNGQGMDRQVQQKAFEMFYRGNQGSEGSGLGLFIVKSNVERLGGQIKIKSKPEHGTEMWIYLPSL